MRKSRNSYLTKFNFKNIDFILCGTEFSEWFHLEQKPKDKIKQTHYNNTCVNFKKFSW